MSFVNLPSAAVLQHFLWAQIARFYDTELLKREWLVALCCAALCLNPWLLRSTWLVWIRRRFHKFAQHRSWAVVCCALFPVIVRLALLPAFPIKPPSVHDEFSLLLMADTFRSGHLTMPTPPLWQHFETIHVIQQPTYGSMYPPGFGVFLAVGQVLGDPWLGVLLTIGLMSAAICWMLQAWMPPAWALVGTVILILQIGIGSYWMNSYVGAASIPAMAGALLLGAVPRFVRKPSWGPAALFAVGVVFLINTRPFEGTALSIGAFVLAAYRYRKSGRDARRITWSACAAALVILAIGALFTGYYSWRVTGSPFKAAYVVNRETYGWPENLAILPVQQLTYRHKILSDMHAIEISRRSRYSTLGRMLDSWSSRVAVIWGFYVGPALTAGLLFSTWSFRSRKYRDLLLISAVLLGMNALQLMAYPQHVSALTSVFFLVLTVGLRRMFVLARRKGFSPERTIAAIVLCCAVCAFLNLGMEKFHIRPGSFWEWPHWEFFRYRAQVASKLTEMPGKHLIIVRYGDFHSPHEEWVYNGADLQGNKLIWANSMGLSSDEELIRHYKDRQPWLVEPDRVPTEILPYTAKTYMAK